MRRTTIAAAALAAVDLVQLAVVLALLAIPLRSGVANPYPSPLVIAMLALFLVIAPILGALVATRRPENPAGWLFLAMSFLLGFGFISDSIARHVPPSPQVGLLVSIGSDIGSFWTVCLTLVTSLFPTGRLPSHRWRLVVALPIVATLMQVTAALFDPRGGISPEIAGVTYPLARPDWQPVLDAMNGAAAALTAAGMVGFLGLLSVRWRRSRGIERQQLKWFVSAMAVIVAVLLVVFVASAFNSDWGNAAWAVFQGSLILLPLAVAAAILRYRLFDIDLIIRRTLVYAVLSAGLVAIYAASVLILSEVLAPLTHAGSLAVAASTLLVAAVFTPGRRAVQVVVDRRFYRARYDATRELEAFRSRLRGELDSSRLAAEVAATLIRTMQPNSVSVWLRQAHDGTVTLPERAARRIEP